MPSCHDPLNTASQVISLYLQVLTFADFSGKNLKDIHRTAAHALEKGFMPRFEFIKYL